MKTLAIIAATTLTLTGCTPLATQILHKAATPTTTTYTSYTDPAPTTPADTGYLPTPTDFRITVTITRQACFGEAGCNIDYEINPTYIGTTPLNQITKQTFRVIYTIQGGDNPQTNSFTVTDGKNLHGDKTGYLSTTGQSTPTITATPTQVVAE